MIGPPQDPRWRALEIGPGGVPAERVRSIGPDGRSLPPPADPTAAGNHAAPANHAVRAAPANHANGAAPADRGAAADRTTPDQRARPPQPVTAPQQNTAPRPARATETGPQHQAQRPPQSWPQGPQQYPEQSTNRLADERLWRDQAGPAAVFGSFDDDRRRPSRKSLLAVLVLATVIAAVALSSLWADGGHSTTAAADLQTTDCLSSADDQSVVVINCASPDAEFSLAAKYDNSRDATRCSTITTDLVMVTKDNTVLCLNYRASVGECLYAGDADRIGKAPCREPGSSTPFGLYRVVAVLPNTVDVRSCPTGTITTLVHAVDREVLCLGMP